MRFIRPMIFGGPVLEIGSGHRPYPQSHVLVDKYVEDSQREGRLRTDGRPLIIADIANLPFRNGAFTFSICSHVLEHVENPARAIAELERVSGSGYIETPSALFEYIEPHRDYHKWFVSREDAGLVFRRKETTAFRQNLLNRLVNTNLSFKLFCASNPDLKKSILEWTRKISFQVSTTPFHPDEYIRFTDQSPTVMAGRLADRLGSVLFRKVAKTLGTFRRRYSIEQMLRCPVCEGAVRVEEKRVVCARCAGFFLREGNLYYLTQEEFEKETSGRRDGKEQCGNEATSS